MKTCSICKEVKDLEAFYFYKGKHRSYCKACQLNYQKDRYWANREKVVKKNRTCSKCKEVKDLDAFYVPDGAGKPGGYCKLCYSRYSTSWSETNQEKIRYRHVKTKYGLSPEAYDALPKNCAICGITEGLGVDHDHATGEVRGILCRKCNIGLGMFDDNSTLLLRAVDYLMGVLKAKAVDGLMKKAGLD